MHRVLVARGSAPRAVASAAFVLPQRRRPLPAPLATAPAAAVLRTHASATRPLFAAPAAKTSPDEPRKKQAKVKKKERVISEAKMKEIEKSDAKRIELMKRAADAPMGKPPPASEEEMARRYQIGRNYVIGCWRRHNELHHDLAVKMRMKRHAVSCLPREGDVGDRLVDGKSLYGRWREEAMRIEDWPGPPFHRHIPMLTPPIEGFDIEKYEKWSEEED